MANSINAGKVMMTKQQDAVSFALDVVTALGEAGLATVPTKPTARMLAAGARSGDVSVETAWKVYQAMVREAE